QLPGFAHEASGLTPASLTGDGIVLGAEIGGLVHRIGNSLRVMLSYTIPPEAPGETAPCVYAGIVGLCSPHSLLVNKYGRRFHRGEHQWRLASATATRGSLGTVAEPPFYGIALQPAGGSSAGLLTNRHAQVMHQRRRPIPGLYASGNAASATEQGVGYQAGLSLASSMTFSYLAIRHMLAGG